MNAPFDSNTILKQLPPLNFGRPSPLSEEAQRYSQYFQLNFEDSYPNIEHNFGFLWVLGSKIATHTYIAPNSLGSVFIYHGYYDHAGLYSHVIQHMLSLGFSVVIYDLPGHGLSTGAQATISDFDDYLEVLNVCLQLSDGHIPKPWHAIAQSTGGGILMDYLLSLSSNNLQSSFDKVILLAPLYQPLNWKRNKVVYHLTRLFTKLVKREFSTNSHDETFTEFVREKDPFQSPHVSVTWVGALNKWIKKMDQHAPSKLSPCIIQGTQDGTVDAYTNIAFIRKKFYYPKVNFILNGRHHLANESESFRQEVFKLIEEELLPEQ